MLNLYWVFKKEWLDTRRDLTGILPILLMPLLFAITSYGALAFIVKLQQPPKQLTLAVINSQHAAPLMHYLTSQGIAIDVTASQPTTALPAGPANITLRIPDNFTTQFRAQRPADLELIWDMSRSDQQAAAQRIKNHVNSWLRTIGAQR